MYLFHGGCNGCTRQQDSGSMAECVGCRYLECDWDLPDKNNEEIPEVTVEDIIREEKAEAEHKARMKAKEEEKRRMVKLAKAQFESLKP